MTNQETDYKHLALEMAVEDFEKFCKCAGLNFNQFKICVEKSRGLTIGQICNKLKLTKMVVRHASKQCGDIK